MERFQFRRHLFLISNHISSSEVENLRFLCSDLLPRRKLEKVKTAFELFCLLEDTKDISTTDTAFLEELLQSLRKKHLIQPLLEQGGGRGLVEARTPHVATPTEATLEYDTRKLLKAFKDVLLAISDDLQESNVRDMALFFFNPNVAGLSLDEIEKIRSGNQLFLVLRDNRTITPTDVQRLRTVLETIGRRDLCEKIDDYMTATKDFIVDPHGGSFHVQGGVHPSDESSGVQSTECEIH